MPSNPSILDEFLELELQRHELYNDIHTFQDEKSHEKLYVDYTQSVTSVLQQLANVSKIVFLRYYDEYVKQGKSKTDETMKQDIFVKMGNTLRMEMDLSVLLLIYAEISIKEADKSVVPSADVRKLINAENHLSFIYSLLFNQISDLSLFNSFKTMMSVIFEKNHSQRMLSLASDSELKTTFDVIGQAHENQGSFYSNHLASFFRKASNEWWWNDSLGSYFIHNQGIINYSKSVECWTELDDPEFTPKAEGIKLFTIPQSIAEASYHQAIHKYDIARLASQKGLHNIATRYFSDSISQCDQALKEIGPYPTGEVMKVLFSSITSLKQKSNLLMELSNINVLFRTSLKALAVGNTELAIENSRNITQLAQSVIGIIDLKYLSSLPTIFESVASTTELMISLDKSETEINEQSQQFIHSFMLRVNSATNGIIRSWDEFVEISSSEKLLEKVNEVLLDLTLLVESISMIPTTLLERDVLLQRLTCLKDLANSIKENALAELTKNDNIILELIHHIKAYFYANRANGKIESLTDKDFPRDKVVNQFADTFLTVRYTFIHLNTLIVQYLCLSDVLPTFFLAVSQDASVITNPEKSISNMQASLELNNPFIDYLDQIERSCSEIILHNQDFPNDRLNFNKLLTRQTLVNAIKKFYNSITAAILGSWMSKVQLFDDALVSFKLAQDAAFEVVDTLGQADVRILSDELSTHIFSFAQFCQKSSSEIADRKIIQLPAQNLFKLLRDMIFSI
jgi:hypothetical protein